MRNRLIELLDGFLDLGYSSSYVADYLIANGVIALPVNAGATIYRPFGSYVETWVVTTVVLYPDEIVFIDDSENSFKESDIGVSTFLTREEAEQALKRKDEGKNDD